MMKLVLLVCLAVVGFAPSQSMVLVQQFEQKFDMLNQWEIFKSMHGKTYRNAAEEAHRHKVFTANLKTMENHNSQNKGYTLGINQYSDLENWEVQSRLNGFRHQDIEANSDALEYLSPATPISSLPDSLDWREHGYVTPVKNQGQCGSCWAFSSTGSLEGQHFRKTKKLVSLSEQNLVDCSTDNQGCNGGLMDLAFQYVKRNHGIDTEVSYPYEAKDDDCHFNNQTIGATDVGYKMVEKGNEEKLKEALATVGPISIAIDASGDLFQSYKSGVYNNPDCSSTQLDHGVLLVGYGTEDGKDYWLVKNSWAETWGEQGYIKMSRNKNNQCGIASYAVFPLV